MLSIANKIIKEMLIINPKTFAIFLGLLVFASCSDAPNKADLILSSSNVILMNADKDAEPLSIAIADKEIVWIGSIKEGKKIQGKHLDYGDQSILPGFIDAHGHASFVAFSTQVANIASKPVGPVNAIENIQSELREFINKGNLKSGEWVIGMGYDDSLLEEQRHPTREDLDAVSKINPIYLIHVSGHLGAANTLGLSLANITSESQDPPGGKIRREMNSSQPNGVLEETAAYPVQQLAMASYKDPMGSVVKAMKIYASNGITTAQDGASNQSSIGLLQAADAQNLLTIDVISFPIAQGVQDESIQSLNFGSYSGRLKMGGVKLILDGSPQGKTAYITKPYLVPPHGQDEQYKGYPLIPQESVDKLVNKYSMAEIPIMAHANGDAAADMLLEAVRKSSISSDHRTVMIHAQTVREDQLDQMKELKIIPSYFSTHTFYWGDWHRDSVFGNERASRISPTNSTLKRGMPFTVHNDAPIVPPDMIRLLWSTTNRLTRSGKVLGPDQRISTYEALKAMTINAAYQHFEEDIKGTIEVGKLADLVVLSENPLSIQTQDLLKLRVVATYSHGKEIFSSSY
ncbi:amidohydrolase [Gammaproteobacteria bacterium]|nr:amidohydrolase [Gammaproteobacteria bacterium]